MYKELGQNRPIGPWLQQWQLCVQMKPLSEELPLAALSIIYSFLKKKLRTDSILFPENTVSFLPKTAPFFYSMFRRS